MEALPEPHMSSVLTIRQNGRTTTALAYREEILYHKTEKEIAAR
jgi:hypothetical protein